MTVDTDGTDGTRRPPPRTNTELATVSKQQPSHESKRPMYKNDYLFVQTEFDAGKCEQYKTITLIYYNTSTDRLV